MADVPDKFKTANDIIIRIRNNRSINHHRNLATTSIQYDLSDSGEERACLHRLKEEAAVSLTYAST